MTLFRKRFWLGFLLLSMTAVAEAETRSLLIDSANTTIDRESVEIVRDIQTPKKIKIESSFTYSKVVCRESAFREVFGPHVNCGTQSGIVRSCYHSEEVCSQFENRRVLVQKTVWIQFKGPELQPGEQEKFKLELNAERPTLSSIEVHRAYSFKSTRFLGREKISILAP